jgi:hypothetical protein
MFQQYRLATTTGSDDGGDFPRGELEVHTLENLLPAKAFV